MRSFPRLFLCAAALTITGCASGRAPHGTPTPAPAPTAAATEIAVAKVRMALAIRRGDAPALAREFTEDAVVITVEGDTLRGRGAIERYVSQSRSALEGYLDDHHSTPERMHLEFTGSKLLECTDGMYEYEGSWSATVTTDDGNLILSGPYAARWQREEGAMRVRTAMFERRAALQHPQRAGCAPAHAARFRERRWQAIISPAYAGSAVSPGSARFERALQEEGFNTHFRSTSSYSRFEATPDVRESAVGLVLAARANVRPPFSIEASFSPAPRAYAITAFRLDSQPQGWDLGREIIMEVESTAAGAVLAYNRPPFRVGAGPIVLRAAWAIREYDLRIRAIDPRMDPGNVRFVHRTAVSAEEWKSVDVGAVAHLGGSYPLTSRLFADIRAEYRLLPDRRTRSVPSLPETEVSTSGFSFGLGVGYAF